MPTVPAAAGCTTPYPLLKRLRRALQQYDSRHHDGGVQRHVLLLHRIARVAGLRRVQFVALAHRLALGEQCTRLSVRARVAVQNKPAGRGMLDLPPTPSHGGDTYPLFRSLREVDRMACRTRASRVVERRGEAPLITSVTFACRPSGHATGPTSAANSGGA